MIIFVFGHLDITQEEFDQHYKNKLNDVIKNGYDIVVCDAKGADTMAQSYLSKLKYDKVTVFHMFESPRVNLGLWKTIGGFKNDEERDIAATKASTCDIAFCKRNGSGTWKNLERRKNV